MEGEVEESRRSQEWLYEQLVCELEDNPQTMWQGD